MIIVNTGIPKSGTTLLCHYQNELLQLKSRRDGQQVFHPKACVGFVKNLNDNALSAMADIESKYGNCLAKTHCELNEGFRKFKKSHVVRVTCNFRDPRDVILSAIDHGSRSREGLDRSGAFQQIHSVEDAIPEVLQWWHVFRTWQGTRGALMIRYEDFMHDKKQVLQDLAKQMDLQIEDWQIDEIYFKYQRKQSTSWNFNKGTTERWKTEMTQQEKELCKYALREPISAMGYSVEP